MSSEIVQNHGAYLQSLGGLHDVEINQIDFDVQGQVLRLRVDDLYANFTEASEYKGFRPCTLTFHDVEAFRFDIEPHEGIRIDDAHVVSDGPRVTVDLDLNLGGGNLTEGRNSMSITFNRMQIVDEK